MRIVAIDAGKRTGVISASVERTARAAELAGASVRRVRLAEHEVRTCTGCGICRATRRCKIDDDLPRLVEVIATADGVIIGTPGLSGPDAEPTQALLARLGGYFEAAGEPVPASAAVAAVKRAVIITSCRSPEPLASFFGQASGPIRALRQALGAGGIKTIGTLAVCSDWTGRARFGQHERDQAVSLGRVLAGKI